MVPGGSYRGDVCGGIWTVVWEPVDVYSGKRGLSH